MLHFAAAHFLEVRMTREQLAERIRWPLIIWFFGLVNVGAMLPQLITILQTWRVDGLALGMFVIYFVIQVAFCLEGYFKRSAMLMWCLGLSALVSAIIISLILYIRHAG